MEVSKWRLGRCKKGHRPQYGHQASNFFSRNLTLNSVRFACGSASAAKESGHFEVRTFSSHVTQMHFFLKKVDDLSLVRRPQNTKAANIAEIVSLSK